MFFSKQLTLWAMLLFSVAASAQTTNCTFQISGQVTDADTRLPIRGATVSLEGNAHRVITDGHGNYVLKGLCSGSYTLNYSSLGFERQQKEVSVEASVSLNVLLHHENIVLHDAEVVGHGAQHRSTSKITSLRGESLEETRGELLAEALSRIAGVSVLKTGNSIAKPVINGMHSNRILILNNGIRQEGQQWGTEHAPEIDPFVAKELSVIKGAEGVRYGPDALGGVVMVNPAPLPIDGPLQGEVNLVGASNGRMGTAAANLTGSVKGLTGFGWRLQGSVKRGGNTRSADYFLGNTGVVERNFSAAAAYNTPSTKYEAYYSHFSTELGILESAHIGTIDDIMARIEFGRPFEDYDFSYAINAPKQRVQHDLGKLKLHKDLNNGAALDVQYALQRNHRQEFDRRRLAEDEARPMIDLVLTTQTLDASYDHLRDNGMRSIWGINGIVQVNNNTPGTGTTPLIPNFDSYTLGAYAVQRYIHDNYELEAGLRYDYRYFDAAGYRYDYSRLNENNGFDLNYFNSNRQFHNLSGTLGVVWHFSDQLDFRSNLGLAWRAPAANELYADGVHHGSAIYEIGNPDMQGEQGYKWINSLTFSNERVNLNLDVYGQYVNNYIFSNPSPDSVRSTIRGTFPVFRYMQTDALFWGADFSATVRVLDQLDYSANISLVRARDVSNDTFLPYIPSDRIDHHLRYTFRNNGKWTKPFFQLGHRFVAEQKRYEPGSDYTPPPPAYHLLEASAGVGYDLGGQKLGLNVSAYNLTNELYKEYMNRFRYYTHEMGRNLMIRLNYTF